jgi:DNA-binding NtrC family response regulator
MTVSPEPRCVLLVDDDDGNRLTVQVLLEDEGFRVEAVASFAAAAAALERAPGAFAFVLLDQNLGSERGLDLLGSVRAHQPAAKVVLISGDLPDLARSALDGFHAKGEGFPSLIALMHRLSPEVSR